MHAIDGLRRALEALPLVVNDVRVRSDAVALAGYPDGPRPTSTATLLGKGHEGFGEHVGWTDAEHRRFRDAAAGLARGSMRLGDWSAALARFPPYDRAALEAAALDLALKQHHTSLLEFAGVSPTPVRYVVSFSRVDDPVSEAETFAGDDPELKIDADPAWPDEVWRRLAVLGRIAIVDFKMGGEVADHEKAGRHLPEAWIEDPKPGPEPWSPGLLCRLSADASVTGVHDLEALLPRPAAVNVKAPRMGGVLEAIEALARAGRLGITAYVGGMFEVGVGRRQSLVLATLGCPDGPNDIAPFNVRGPRVPRLVASADVPGFSA